MSGWPAVLSWKVVRAVLSSPVDTVPPLLEQDGWQREEGGLALRREESLREPMGPTLRRLLDAGVSVHELSVQPPRLEEVFLGLVGAAGKRA